MASANDSSKRRRLLNDASPDAGCLSDLPSGILTHVANYLAPPSRALFSAALTNQNTAASDERNTAIVSNEWTTLDFGGIEKDLAERLSDDDIGAVLQCIDAANRVKKLKLTNCVNITGAGLEPLRRSTIIEQIDLSLVGDHQCPYINPYPPISREFVLPILDSIIEREGCSLRHVQYPYEWRAEEMRHLLVDRGVLISVRTEKVREFEQILRRYNEMLVNRGVSCLKCNVNLPPENGSWGCSSYGSQNYTCYECLKHYCEVCTDDDDKDMLSYCLLCEKRLCTDCQKKKWCYGCEGDFCMDCTDFTDCSGCGVGLCKDCIASDSNCKKCYKCEEYFCERNCDNQIWASCDSCKKNCCRECDEEDIWTHNEKNGTDAIQFCDDCDTCYCGKCRAYMCQEKSSHMNCAGCIQLAGPFFLEENKTLRNENKEVKAENETLRDKVSLTQNHNNSLKQQLQNQMERVKELEEKMKQISE
eukprot:scaffold9073_cov180-Skeletonema_dohrnii-CCMP3373.AAC.9